MSSAIESALEAQDQNDHLDAATAAALSLGPAAAREQARVVPSQEALNRVAKNAAVQLGLAWSCPSEALDACATEALSPLTPSSDAAGVLSSEQQHNQASTNRTPAQSAALLEVGQHVLLMREAAAAAAVEKEKGGISSGVANVALWKAAGDEQASDALVALAIKVKLVL